MNEFDGLMDGDESIRRIGYRVADTEPYDNFLLQGSDRKCS